MTSPPASRHPVSRRPALLRAAAAVSCALLLLTGGAVTHARWHQEQPLTTQQIRTGQLAVALGTASTTVEHTDLTAGTTSVQRTSRTLAPGTDAQNLVVGDTVTTSVPITLTASGTRLTATLRVAPGAVTGTASLVTEAAGNTSFTLAPTGGAPALSPVAGQARAWTVTGVHDGATHTLTMTTRIRATTDGTARSATVGSGNWWGAALQGATLDPVRLTVTLTQN